MITTLRKPLTLRQNQVYNTIVRYREKHGVTPTCRELGEILGFWPSGARYNLEVLIKKGWLKVTNGKRCDARCLVPVGLERHSRVDARTLRKMTGLSVAQAETLAIVLNHWRNGVPPTLTEIAEARNLSSRNAAQQILCKLIDSGWIRHEDKKRRCWIPTQKTLDVIGKTKDVSA